MNEKIYYFIVSIPKESHIEFVTKLNSFILKQFPGKNNPYTIRPLEIRDNDTLSKVTIKTTEENITRFSDSLFGKDYLFLVQNNNEIEIVRKDSVEFNLDDKSFTRH